MNKPLLPLHGGPDGGPAIAHDFSSNANPLGPPPALREALLQADRSRYPDPHYTALREQLGREHGVDAQLVLPTAGGAEAIRRLSLVALLQGLREVWVPQPGFGDYALAAQALGLQVRCYTDRPAPQEPALVWFCEPCNPTGLSQPLACAAPAGSLLVVDLACEPLRLGGRPPDIPAGFWQLHCPNKALGLTGVRAAYLLAPAADEAWACALTLAPSWVLASEGQVLLAHWHGAQEWLDHSRAQLREWSASQRAALASLGWEQRPSLTNFWLARPPAALPDLRARGIKLRDAESLGAPGWWRIAALPPASQQALLKELTP